MDFTNALQLTEARKNPAANPKVGFREFVKQIKSSGIPREDLFITYRKAKDKRDLFVNINYKYKNMGTPIGVYAFPLDIEDSIEKGNQSAAYKAGLEFFGYEANTVMVLQNLLPKEKVLWLTGDHNMVNQVGGTYSFYGNGNYESLFKAINKVFGKDSKFGQRLGRRLSEEGRDGEKVADVVVFQLLRRSFSSSDESSERQYVLLSKILMLCGYDAIIDTNYNITGDIKEQAVFFKPSAFKILGSFKNESVPHDASKALMANMKKVALLYVKDFKAGVAADKAMRAKWDDIGGTTVKALNRMMNHKLLQHGIDVVEKGLDFASQYEPKDEIYGKYQ